VALGRATISVTSPITGLDLIVRNSMDVLVAENDPVNSKVAQKKLEKLGALVLLTANGEDCCICFPAKHPPFCDAIHPHRHSGKQSVEAPTGCL
jgi:hypothetical protein